MLQSDRQLANTRRKLRMLEEDYEAARADTQRDPRERELAMESLKRLINQFKEEVARYEAHVPARP